MQQDGKGFSKNILKGYIDYEKALHKRMAAFKGAVSETYLLLH